MKNSYTVYATKIIAEFFTSLLFFPLWWYTKGLVKLVKQLFSFLKGQEKSLALFVWIKNIFKPMYGETGWQGRLVSLLVRIVQVIARSIIMIIILVFAIFILIFWLILPLLVIRGIFFQLFYNF